MESRGPDKIEIKNYAAELKRRVAILSTQIAALQSKHKDEVGFLDEAIAMESPHNLITINEAANLNKNKLSKDYESGSTPSNSEAIKDINDSVERYTDLNAAWLLLQGIADHIESLMAAVKKNQVSLNELTKLMEKCKNSDDFVSAFAIQQGILKIEPENKAAKELFEKNPDKDSYYPQERKIISSKNTEIAIPLNVYHAIFEIKPEKEVKKSRIEWLDESTDSALSLPFKPEQIDDYSNPDTITPNQVLVDEALASALYDGISKYRDKYDKEYVPADQLNNDKYYRKYRTQFFLHLNKVISENKRYTGDEITRTITPEKANISLDKLLGEEGVKLYKLALEEEENSVAFRQALLLNSTSQHPDHPWKQRPITVVGGPSSSGKTKASKKAIEKVIQNINKDTTSPKINNYIIACDGGLARETSQIYKAAIRASNMLGYTGVSDLYKESERISKAKKYIVNVALNENCPHGVVIPNTFSKLGAPIFGVPTKNQMESIVAQAKNGAKVFFCLVEGKDKDLFKKIVAYIGSRRAWKTSWKTGERISADVNNKENLCESKAYGGEGFDRGVDNSANALKYFEDKCGANFISMKVINDLVFVKLTSNDADPKIPANWNIIEKDEPNAIAVSEKNWETWRKNPNGVSLQEFERNNYSPTIIPVDAFEILEDFRKLRKLIKTIKSEPEKEKLIEISSQIYNLLPGEKTSDTLIAIRDAIKEMSSEGSEKKALSEIQKLLVNIVAALNNLENPSPIVRSYTTLDDYTPTRAATIAPTRPSPIIEEILGDEEKPITNSEPIGKKPDKEKEKEKPTSPLGAVARAFGSIADRIRISRTPAPVTGQDAINELVNALEKLTPEQLLQLDNKIASLQLNESTTIHIGKYNEAILTKIFLNPTGSICKTKYLYKDKDTTLVVKIFPTLVDPFDPKTLSDKCRKHVTALYFANEFADVDKNAAKHRLEVTEFCQRGNLFTESTKLGDDKKRQEAGVTHIKNLIEIILDLNMDNIYFPDIKPANFLIRDNGSLVISDTKNFIRIDDKSKMIDFDKIRTSPNYLPSDIIPKEAKLIDIEALQKYLIGISIYEFMTGATGDPRNPDNTVSFKKRNAKNEHVFNFEHAVFKDGYGPAIANIIKSLTDSTRSNRMSLADAKSALNNIRPSSSLALSSASLTKSPKIESAEKPEDKTKMTTGTPPISPAADPVTSTLISPTERLFAEIVDTEIDFINSMKALVEGCQWLIDEKKLSDKNIGELTRLLLPFKNLTDNKNLQALANASRTNHAKVLEGFHNILSDEITRNQFKEAVIAFRNNHLNNFLNRIMYKDRITYDALVEKANILETKYNNESNKYEDKKKNHQKAYNKGFNDLIIKPSQRNAKYPLLARELHNLVNKADEDKNLIQRISKIKDDAEKFTDTINNALGESTTPDISTLTNNFSILKQGEHTKGEATHGGILGLINDLKVQLTKKKTDEKYDQTLITISNTEALIRNIGYGGDQEESQRILADITGAINDIKNSIKTSKTVTNFYVNAMKLIDESAFKNHVDSASQAKEDAVTKQDKITVEPHPAPAIAIPPNEASAAEPALNDTDDLDALLAELEATPSQKSKSEDETDEAINEETAKNRQEKLKGKTAWGYIDKPEGLHAMFTEYSNNEILIDPKLIDKFAFILMAILGNEELRNSASINKADFARLKELTEKGGVITNLIQRGVDLQNAPYKAYFEALNPEKKMQALLADEIKIETPATTKRIRLPKKPQTTPRLLRSGSKITFSPAKPSTVEVAGIKATLPPENKVQLGAYKEKTPVVYPKDYGNEPITDSARTASITPAQVVRLLRAASLRRFSLSVPLNQDSLVNQAETQAKADAIASKILNGDNPAEATVYNQFITLSDDDFDKLFAEVQAVDDPAAKQKTVIINSEEIDKILKAALGEEAEIDDSALHDASWNILSGVDTIEIEDLPTKEISDLDKLMDELQVNLEASSNQLEDTGVSDEPEEKAEIPHDFSSPTNPTLDDPSKADEKKSPAAPAPIPSSEDTELDDGLFPPHPLGSSSSDVVKAAPIISPNVSDIPTNGIGGVPDSAGAKFASSAKKLALDKPPAFFSETKIKTTEKKKSPAPSLPPISEAAENLNAAPKGPPPPPSDTTPPPPISSSAPIPTLPAGAAPMVTPAALPKDLQDMFKGLFKTAAELRASVKEANEILTPLIRDVDARLNNIRRGPNGRPL